ncbi:MAG TPA: ATP synthase subunit I [Gallionella sp.]|jgi:ATP synthase protein I|nr:ATP synthase subunit I [Gallionella sp.]
MNDSANTTNTTTISRAVSQAARWQVIATALVTLVLLAFADVHAAVSALLGGSSVIAGCYAGAVVAGNDGNTKPAALLLTLLKAEVIKIVVIVLLLLVIYRYYEGLVPLALIGGLASAALISGAGLRTVNNENQK